MKAIMRKSRSPILSQRRRRSLFALLIASSFLAVASHNAWAATVRVAVAANFKPALLTLAPLFEKAHGHTLRVSAASTGVLYNQILNGAPFDILLAADDKHPRLLEERGLAVSGSRFTYAAGQLVLVYRPRPGATGLTGILTSPGLTLAIANPALAPYGSAAMEIISRHATLADDAKLLRGANVLQAYQFWYSGGADAALVPRSLVKEGFLAVPADWYSAPRQQAVLLKSAANPAAASELLAFLRTAATRRRIVALGYTLEAASGG
jgi:molybdate transport system substrate-binding protein